MVWIIAKKELLDHLVSLRFAFVIVLTLVLNIVLGVVFPREYQRMIEMKADDEKFAMESLRMRSNSLARVGLGGPSLILKHPSDLGFITWGGEKDLPRLINGRPPFGGFTTAPWVLEYEDTESTLYRKSRLIPFELDLDWGFIIGVVMSLTSIALMFDRICGEREGRTLGLMLANPVSRSSILLGKYLGTLLALAIPLLSGMLICLLIARVSIGVEKLLLISMAFLASLVYLSIFLLLSLAISSKSASSLASLIFLLLIWIFFVVFVPDIISLLSKKIVPITPGKVFEQQKKAYLDGLKEEYYRRKGYLNVLPSKDPKNRVVIERWGRYLEEYQKTLEMLRDRRLDQMLRQVEMARMLGRISPYQVYLYVLEAAAGTGFTHHKAFVKSVRKYREAFRRFIAEKDAEDPESFHILYVEEGISKRPIALREIPIFRDSYGIGEWMRYGTMDMGILFLSAALAALLSYLSFMRADVR
jgi:ABC-type transport system involved in multi-copper enzyme maturation permease subunit